MDAAVKLTPIVLSMALTTALFAASPDSGSIILKNQEQKQFPTTNMKTMEQSGLAVYAVVTSDEIAILDAPKKSARALKTLPKGDEIKLSGIEKDGYYELQDGGFIAKSSVKILSQIGKVSVSHRGEVRMRDSLVADIFAYYTKDGVDANSLDGALSAVKSLGNIDAAVFLKPRGNNYDITLGVIEGKPYSAYLSLDNYGDHTTGIYRKSLGASLNDKFGYGENISASIVTTGQELLMGSLVASIPISSDASSMSMGVSKMKYKLGDVFASMESFGTSTTAFVGYNKPLWLSHKGSMNYGFRLSRSNMSDTINAFDTVTYRQSTALDNILSFVKQDSFMGGGTNGAFADFKLGRLEADASDDPYSKVGGYAKLNIQLQRAQQLGEFTGIASFKVQKAFKNLDSSEKFNLTGIDGVGGYYSGDIVGDEGYLVSLELDRALPILSGLSGGVNYTNGVAKTMYSPIDNSNNIQKASSVGLKLIYSAPHDITANAGLYKRLSGELVNNYDSTYRFLFNIAKKF
jgi:hemolysin activation/secretion protein